MPNTDKDKVKDKNLKEAFIAMKKEIENIPHEKIHYYIFKYFDVVSWIESKMKNKSFQEIIKEKK